MKRHSGALQAGDRTGEPPAPEVVWVAEDRSADGEQALAWGGMSSYCRCPHAQLSEPSALN